LFYLRETQIARARAISTVKDRPDGLGKPGTMTGGGAGSVTGDKVYTGSGVEKYTLTPIEPCK